MAEDEGDYVQEFSLLESTGQRVVLKVYVYVFFFLESRLAGDFVKKSIHK